MNNIIIEYKPGKTTTLNPIGLKQFATAIDTPERIKVDETDGKVLITVSPRPENEKTIPITIDNKKYVVGSMSGVIVEASSGTTIQNMISINNEQTKSQIKNGLQKTSNRIQKNLDASLSLISQIAQIKPVNKLNVMTRFDDFINSNEWNDMELLYMCDTINEDCDFPPFKLLPANNSKENIILVYEPTGDSLILKPAAKARFINKVEELFCKGEPYDIYLNWKMAVEKDD